MLDPRFIRENAEAVRRNIRLRGYNVDLDTLLRFDVERRRIVHELDNVRRLLNAHSLRWREAKDKDAHRREGVALKQRALKLEDELMQVEEGFEQKLAWLPNMLDPRVPIGGDDQNKVVSSGGRVKDFQFVPRSHEELGVAHGLLDLSRATNVAKSRFYFLKNQGLEMRFALIRLFLDSVRGQGWEFVSPPLMARTRTLFASGYLPFATKDNFKIEGEDLSLIGTSEQALLGMHLDELLTNLPKLYLGDSMCFRTEAGSHGRETTGIIRVHQFYKLEQFVYCHPSESEHWHQQCLDNEIKLLRTLDLPYQVVLTASEDLGAPGAIKYDTEVWIPSQGRYREMTSNTNLRDFQTRRGNIRFRQAGEKGFPHTISATGFCDRLIVAILENYQQEDGSIRIPSALVPYMEGIEAIGT